VCTMTARGEVEFVNQRILDYTGKTSEELRDWGPLVHPDDLALVITRWMRSIETGDACEVEHRILRADGVYCWFHVRGLPLRDSAFIEFSSIAKPRSFRRTRPHPVRH
jgi:PAS domain S-box-containing protein